MAQMVVEEQAPKKSYLPRGRIFTKLTSQLALQAKRRYSKQYMKLQKQLAKIGLEDSVIKQIVALMEVIASTPLGSWLAVYLLVDLLGKIGWLSNVTSGATSGGGAQPAKQGLGAGQIIEGIFTALGGPVGLGIGALLSTNLQSTELGNLLGMSEVNKIKTLLLVDGLFAAIAPAGSALLSVGLAAAKATGA